MSCAENTSLAVASMADKRSTKDSELDDWLAELAGKRVGSASDATRLRKLILDEHRDLEAEFDEMRERRLRTRVLSELANTSGSRKLSPAWSRRPLAIAASVMLIVIGGLLVNRMSIDPDGVGDPGWVLSYGDLQRTRGEVQMLRANVGQPEKMARRLGADLARQTVIFEMTPQEDGTYRVELYVPNPDAVERLNTALRSVDLTATSQGYYILIIE